VVLSADRRGRLVFVVQWYRTLCCRDSLGDGRGNVLLFLVLEESGPAHGFSIFKKLGRGNDVEKTLDSATEFPKRVLEFRFRAQVHDAQTQTD